MPETSPDQRANPFHLWLERAAARDPAKPLIESIEQQKTLTYGEMLSLADRVAATLTDRGIGAGDRVALLSGNSIEHLAVFFGVLCHGATICTVHVEMNAAYFGDILRVLNPKLVLWEDGHDLEKLADDCPGDWQALGDWQPDGGTGFFASLPAIAPPAKPVGTLADDAVILFTSGTRSAPKGVVLSRAEIADNIPPTAAMLAMTEADRILDFRSFNWASAQLLGALTPLYCGATLILARRFSQSRYFQWLRDFRATIGVCNPTALAMLLNRPVAMTGNDLPSLRFLTSSSAPLPVEQWQRFEEHYGIIVAQGYGSSETGWIAGSNETTRRHGTVGRPQAYHRLTIVGEDGSPLPPGETGEVELGGTPGRRYRMLGEDGAPLTTATGRYRTGDLGFLDADGYLHLTGRAKELIIRGGVNIAPAEIDNVLLALDGVAEAAAVGVPDAIYGEEVVAYVVAKPGAALDEAAVAAHCAARLAEPKHPRHIIFRDALPKTERGKLDRVALAAEWQAGAVA